MWDGAAEYKRMQQLANAEQQRWFDQTVTVRIFNKFVEEEGVVGNYLSLSFGFKRNDVGVLAMTLPHDTQFRDFLLNNEDGENATIIIVVETQAKRWEGMVDRIALLRDEDGTETIDVSALHLWEHVKHICCWASPFAPLAAQWPRHMTVWGGTKTVINTYLTANLIRLQANWWSTPYDYGDAPSWVELGGAMWPICVVPSDPLKDTTKWTAAIARFEMAHELFQPLLDDAGLMLTARLFLPDEDEQPAPDWYYLDRPTIVLEVLDKSGVTGTTGTWLDGVTQFFEDFLDDGQVERYPANEPETDYEQDYTVGVLGTKTAKPWVRFREGEFSGISSSEIAIHKPLATDVIVGGRSPGWVNAGIEMAIKNMLAWLGLLIGLPGLDSLYQGQLDDVFLAFARIQDRERARQAGPFAYREHFVTGSDKAFTLDGVMALHQGNWDTRGYTSKKVTVDAVSAPYTFGEAPKGGHYDIGDQITFEIDNWLYTDYVTEATFVDDRSTASKWEIVIGDGADEESELMHAHRQLSRLASIVKRLSLDVGASLDLPFIDWF